MAADPLDVNNLPPVVNCDDEAEIVALDIENRPIRADDAGRPIGTLQLGGILPCGTANLVEPGIESILNRHLRFLTGKRLDEPRQRTASDHTQDTSVARSQTGN